MEVLKDGMVLAILGMIKDGWDGDDEEGLCEGRGTKPSVSSLFVFQRQTPSSRLHKKALCDSL